MKIETTIQGTAARLALSAAAAAARRIAAWRRRRRRRAVAARIATAIRTADRHNNRKEPKP